VRGVGDDLPDASVLRVIVDTDLSLGPLGSEIDDGLALAMVVAEPRLNLQAVTTNSGNVDAASAAFLVLDLLRRLEVEDVPVYRGAMTALCDPVPRRPSILNPEQARSIAGLADGYAADELARRVMEAPGEITIISIGPMTNIAAAINLEPGFASSVKEIVVMGGTYFRDLSWGGMPGEFNFCLDPDAVQVVLSSGARVRLVGLDVTTQVRMSHSDADALRSRGGDFAEFASDRVQAWITRLATEYPDDPDTGDSCSLHDPLTVAAVISPELLEWRAVHVDVVTRDELTRGATVVDLLESPQSPSPNCSVAIAVDFDAARDLIFGLLARLP
jgi:purine nucleosidase